MTTTVAGALGEARARGVAALDAQLLLARLLALTRTGLITADDRVLTSAERERWSAALARRADGEPLAYLLGEKEFHGLVLAVSADVLVPRPETELLVDWASQLLGAMAASMARPRVTASPSVVDLGTGSGAIALALKHLHPAVAFTGTDASRAALQVARHNAERHGLAVEWLEASWWDGLAGRRFDLVVANPPYVAADDPHLADLRHEPLAALTPGGDGLGAIAAIVGGAPAHLHAGGWLLLEHGFDQASAIRALLAKAGLVEIETRVDLAGHERASGGRCAAAN